MEEPPQGRQRSLERRPPVVRLYVFHANPCGTVFIRRLAKRALYWDQQDVRSLVTQIRVHRNGRRETYPVY